MVFSFLVTLPLETSSAKMTSGSLVSRISFGELIYGQMVTGAFLMMSVKNVFTSFSDMPLFWNRFLSPSRDLLELPDEKAVSYTCMVIHTCLDEHKTQQLVKDTQCLKLSLKIMDLCRTLPDVDWT